MSRQFGQFGFQLVFRVLLEVINRIRIQHALCLINAQNEHHPAARPADLPDSEDLRAPARQDAQQTPSSCAIK